MGSLGNQAEKMCLIMMYDHLIDPWNLIRVMPAEGIETQEKGYPPRVALFIWSNDEGSGTG
jgi:hypothetical protein